MIQTNELTKKYGDFTAVNRVNLNIPEGQIYGFLGPNGAGKTSTIMMLLGMTSPTSGEIFLFGERYTQDRLDLRKRIGVVPEKHPTGMWTWMTALEYLQMFAELYEVENAVERIPYMLEKVGLADATNRRIDGYSRGMLQKLSFVRALLPDPDMLFLDEPISGLDPIGIKQLRDLILEENREGRTIFISSHLLSEMEKICHRLAIIHMGNLLAEDTMDSLLLQISKEKEIIIELESVPEWLLEDLRSLDFVLGGEAVERRVSVKVPKEGDFRKALSEFLIKKNLVPLSLSLKSFSLEEAFVTITQENVERLAAMGGER
jgi:ABC-type multidrug transport system ATPase subunit